VEKVQIICIAPHLSINGLNVTFDYPEDMPSGKKTITITLVDDKGGRSESRVFDVNVTRNDRIPVFKYPPELYILVPLALLAGAAAILAFRRYKYGWYEVKRAFLVYQDGRMLAHAGEKTESDDEMLVSSMFTAVQQFIEEAMKKDKAGAIKEFLYEDMKIAVEKGRRLFLAVILKGYTTDSLRNRMKEMVVGIEARNEKALKEWDGRMTRLPLIEEAVKELEKLAGKDAGR